jgi:hypothetical protein
MTAHTSAPEQTASTGSKIMAADQCTVHPGMERAARCPQVTHNQNDPLCPEVEISRLNAPRFFGEHALLSNGTTNANITAVTDMSLLVISPECFRANLSSVEIILRSNMVRSELPQLRSLIQLDPKERSEARLPLLRLVCCDCLLRLFGRRRRPASHHHRSIGVGRCHAALVTAGRCQVHRSVPKAP